MTSLLCNTPGLEQPGVGALDEADAGVGAELHGDLAEAGVNGDDMGCAMLEEAVSEDAGGGTDVEAGAGGDDDGPVGKGSGELEAAAADVLLLFAEDADESVGGDGDAGLVELLLVDEDATGEDEGAGTGAARNKGSLDEKQVKAGF